MEQALSLKTGEYVSAHVASHASSKSMLLVCPECGEPVYFKARETPYPTPFFAHYKELETIKLTKNCSLRIAGSTMQRASQLLPKLLHGQLVDKFQKSFCIELHNLFGKYSKKLIEFIRESNFLPLQTRDYKDLISQIEIYSEFQDISLKHLETADVTNLTEGITDVCIFLRSQYGNWVGNFIYQTSYFLACIIHPDTINKNLGKTRYVTETSEAIFIVELFRLKKYLTYAVEVLPATGKRNLIIAKIASIITALLIIKWRESKSAPRLLVTANDARQGFDFKNFKPRNPKKIINRTQKKITYSEPLSSNLPQEKDLKTSDKPVFRNSALTSRDEQSQILSWHSGQSTTTAHTWDSTNRVRPYQSYATPANSNKPENKFDRTSISINRAEPLSSSWLPRTVIRHWDTAISSNSCSTNGEKQSQIRSWPPVDAMKGPSSTNRVPHSQPQTPLAEISNRDHQKITDSSKHRSGITNAEASPKNNVAFKYAIRTDDINRINLLIGHAENLSAPPRLANKIEITHWAKIKNPFEAYFLAEYLKIPHDKPEFSDYTLNQKLEAWLKWSRKNI